MNSNGGSVEDKLSSLLQSPQMTSEALMAVTEVFKLIMVLSPSVRSKVEALVLSNTRGGVRPGVTYFVDSLPRELYWQVLVDLAAAPNLTNFNWLKHALASQNVLTSDEWELLLLKPMISNWSTVETLVTELSEAQQTKLMGIVSQFQITNSNSIDEDQQKSLEFFGKPLPMPKKEMEPHLQPQTNSPDGHLDIITIDDDDDDDYDESTKKDELRIKVETMCSNSDGPISGTAPNNALYIKPDVLKTDVKPKIEKVEPNVESKVYLIPGSRKVTPGGSVIQVFQRSGKRKRKSGSQTPSQHASSSESGAIHADTDKGSIVTPASLEDTLTGSKRRRSHDIFDQAENVTRSSLKQATSHSSASPSGESPPLQSQINGKKGRLPVVSPLKSSDDTSGIGSRSVSPRDSISPSTTLGRHTHSQKEDDEDSSHSGDDPEVVYDECCICSESIPRMMDNPRSSMIHHMAQEHDDIPSGSTSSSPNCDVRCCRCRLFFQDLFIKDLHEKKACRASECEGCKLSSSQSETMRLLHLASIHGDIPPGCPTQMPLSGEQCLLCRLWFHPAILKFHVKQCAKTTHLQ